MLTGNYYKLTDAHGVTEALFEVAVELIRPSLNTMLDTWESRVSFEHVKTSGNMEHVSIRSADEYDRRVAQFYIANLLLGKAFELDYEAFKQERLDWIENAMDFERSHQ